MCERGQCVEVPLRKDRHRQKRRSFDYTSAWRVCLKFELFSGGGCLLKSGLESWIRSTTGLFFVLQALRGERRAGRDDEQHSFAARRI